VRNLLVVLSSAVITGLVGYFTLSVIVPIRVFGDSVMIPINAFVALIVSLTTCASATGLLLRWALQRADGAKIQQLEERLGRLEQHGATER
jgi:hypothetical protein